MRLRSELPAGGAFGDFPEERHSFARGFSSSHRIWNSREADGSSSTAWVTTSSTRENSEPRRTVARNSSNAGESPCASHNTEPSRSLRTQPTTPWRRAARSVKYRNPTPCTRPEIRARSLISGADATRLSFSPGPRRPAPGGSGHRRASSGNAGADPRREPRARETLRHSRGRRPENRCP